MRVSLRETKDNARTELAAGWESIRAELSRAQEQIAAAANQEADRKAAAVLVELDAQLAQSRDEVKEQKRLLQIADAKLDAKETAKEADKVSLF